MLNPPHLSVVIPVYNEEKRIAWTLNQIIDHLENRGFKQQVIIVNDGSTDNSLGVCLEHAGRRPGVSVLDSAVNEGKGAAVKKGVLAAEHELILVTDADLATPIDDLDKLLAQIKAGHSIVIGSRNLPASDVRLRQPVYRRWLGKLFSLLVRWLALPGVKDSQCGFKLFTRDAARRIFPSVQTDGFSFDVEVLLVAKRAGYEVVEVPVAWSNNPDTRLDLFPDGFRMLADLLRIVWAARVSGKGRRPSKETAKE